MTEMLPAAADSAMSNPGYISLDVARSQLDRTLRMYVGRGRPYAVAALAEVAEVPERTIKSYFGSSTPAWHTFLNLARVLRGNFIAQAMAPAGVAAVIMHDDAEVCPKALAKEQSAHLATLIAALEDGRIDHTEAPELVEQARTLLPLLTAFIREHENKT